MPAKSRKEMFKENVHILSFAIIAHRMVHIHPHFTFVGEYCCDIGNRRIIEQLMADAYKQKIRCHTIELIICKENSSHVIHAYCVMQHI